MVTNKVPFRQIDGTLVRNRQVLTAIHIPFGQNFKVLSVASNETPSESANVAAIISSGKNANYGAVAASLLTFAGVFSLAAIATDNVLTPLNLIRIRDNTTHNPILSSGREIFGLLQTDSRVQDGDTFDDSTKILQISFVVQNSNGNSFIAAPIVDIQNKIINYEYRVSFPFSQVESDDFMATVFQEPFQGGGSGSGDVSNIYSKLFLIAGI